MANIEGKAQACFDWARKWPELDEYLKFNSFVTEDGEASLATLYNDVAIETYIDGTAKRKYTFMLRMMLPWSDGYDSTNLKAERKVASWLDWVSEQYPENVPDFGAEITDIRPVQNAPSLDQVYEDDGLAAYLFQAEIIYTE